MPRRTRLNLSDDTVLRAYREMRLIREFEDRVNREMATGDVPGAVHLYAGQEASAVGVCMHLKGIDWIASTHRGHGHSIAKGCNVDGMMAEIFGRRNGICHGKGGSMHIADMDRGMMGANGIVGAGPPMIVGAALSAKLLKTGGVAVAFAGDGAFNQGTTAESLNLAAIWKLPVIFVIEDNGFAEATSSDYATAGQITDRARAFEIPSDLVDGLDFFKVYAACEVVVKRARSGEGPSLLHIKTPRYYGHFSGDADTYRTDQEKVSMRKDADCLKILRRNVCERSSLPENLFDAIDNEVHDLIDKAVEVARGGAFPDPGEVETDVYSSY